MGEFWIQVLKSFVEFVFLALVSFGGVKAGIAIRKAKNNSSAKNIAQ